MLPRLPYPYAATSIGALPNLLGYVGRVVIEMSALQLLRSKPDPPQANHCRKVGRLVRRIGGFINVFALAQKFKG